MTDKSGLYLKLQAVMKTMDGIELKGKHSQGWRFMRADDVFNAARASFLDEGLLIIPGVLPDTLSQREGMPNKSGSMEYRSMFVATFTIIDSETGASIDMSWPCESSDYSDKGIQQAGTSGMKYMLMKMFLATPDHDPDYNADSTPDTTSAEVEVPDVIIQYMQQFADELESSGWEKEPAKQFVWNTLARQGKEAMIHAWQFGGATAFDAVINAALPDMPPESANNDEPAGFVPTATQLAGLVKTAAKDEFFKGQPSQIIAGQLAMMLGLETWTDKQSWAMCGFKDRDDVPVAIDDAIAAAQTTETE